jgi:Polyketide cyclase / dehydrase and lipid transport
MRIGVTESIAASAESIFTFSQDYSKRLSWDPFLREATLLANAVSAGVGTRSWCVTWFGLGMESEYVSYHPPQVVAVKMTKGPWLLRQFAASWNFHAVGTNQTEVGFLYSFQVQPFLRVLTPLIGAFFRYEMRRRLRSLKRACESN